MSPPSTIMASPMDNTRSPTSSSKAYSCREEPLEFTVQKKGPPEPRLREADATTLAMEPSGNVIRQDAGTLETLYASPM